MKVLFMTTAYPTPESPVAGIFVKEHARAAAEHADIAVVHLDRGGGSAASPKPVAGEEFPTLRIGYPARPVPVSIAAHIAGACRAFGAVRRAGFEPDLIHAHFFLAGLPAVLIGRRVDKAVVITEQWSVFLPSDPMALTGTLRRSAQYAFEHADLVLPASDALRRGIEAQGISASFRVVPNVVDTSLFHPGDRARDGVTRLLAVGLLYEAKGYELLLEAVSRLADERRAFHIDVVGDGPDRGAYEELAASLGVADRVTFHGLKTKPEVAAFMRSADLFVLTSRYDNNPCVLIEAMASGLPVVATAVGGIPEIVDASSGRLATPNDPASIAAEIAGALDGIERFDRPAIAWAAKARFGREHVGRMLADAYAEAIQRRQAALVA
jgi:glycosyltransferase involved in cell wall biosynthesis